MQSGSRKPLPYKESSGKPRFLVPLIVGALLFAAILTVPRLLSHRTETQPAATVGSGKQPSSAAATQKSVAPGTVPVGAKPNASSIGKTKSVAPAVPQADQRAPQPAAPESLKRASEKEPAPAAAAPAGQPAALAGVSSKGEVLDQVLPDVSGKARATIHGKVRVSVKVHVDPSGGVSRAEFDSPGPSKFFADLALQAARKWAFTPPEVNGKSVESDWRLRFEFTPKDTKVAPAQIAP
jgi:protein TonB